MTVNDWVLALALVCIIEGFMPFVAPTRWLEAVREISQTVSASAVRKFGFILLTLGVSIIWCVTL